MLGKMSSHAMSTNVCHGRGMVAYGTNYQTEEYGKISRDYRVVLREW